MPSPIVPPKPTALHVTRDVAMQIAKVIDTQPREEICGLLAGKTHEATIVFPIQNDASIKNTAFKMNDADLLRALKQIDRSKQRILATYHSHPNNNLMISAQDIEALGRNWPHVCHIIACRKAGELLMKAWTIQGQDVSSVPIQVDKRKVGHDDSQRLSKAQQVAIILATGITVVILIALAVTLLPPPPDLTNPFR